MKFIAESEDQTTKAAQDLAPSLRARDLVLLHGDLGAGKSVFARALIRTLVADQNLEIPSPTFTLLQTYESPKGPISHYDLYRLKNAEEIFELGWEESLNSGITIVEWPERLGPLTPAQRLDIRLSNVKNKPDSRTIEITRVEL